MDEIEKFIYKFKKGFNQEEVENIFLNGNCYYFSSILNNMFSGYIAYDVLDCHFIFKTLNGNSYDITGKIQKDKYKKVYSWFQLQQLEPDLATNIRENCINLNNK